MHHYRLFFLNLGIKLSLALSTSLLCFFTLLQLTASQKHGRTSAVLQSPTLRVQSHQQTQLAPGPYDPKMTDSDQEGGPRPAKAGGSSYSKRYHYANSHASPEKAPSYGRIYDSATKRYEVSPSKISYEIKLYIPKHDVEHVPARMSSYYEEAQDYPPQALYGYDERPIYSFNGPKYDQKMPSYMKPFYTADGRTLYETKPAVAPVYGERRPMVLYASPPPPPPPVVDYEPSYRPPQEAAYKPAEVYRPPSTSHEMPYKMDSPLGYNYRPSYEMTYRPAIIYRPPPPESPASYESNRAAPESESVQYKVKVKPEMYSYESAPDQQQLKTLYEKSANSGSRAPPDSYIAENKYSGPSDLTYASGLMEPAYNYGAQPAVYYAVAYPPPKPAAAPEMSAYYPSGPPPITSHYVASPPSVHYSNPAYGVYANYR